IASTSVSSNALAVALMPCRTSATRSGQVAIASTAAQARAGRKRHSIQTPTTASATNSTLRMICCAVQFMLTLIPNPSAAPAIGRHALVGQPDVAGQAAGLPEDVDRHAAAREEIAADAEVARLEQRDEALADRHG